MSSPSIHILNTGGIDVFFLLTILTVISVFIVLLYFLIQEVRKGWRIIGKSLITSILIGRGILVLLLHLYIVCE